MTQNQTEHANQTDWPILDHNEPNQAASIGKGNIGQTTANLKPTKNAIVTLGWVRLETEPYPYHCYA